MIKPLLAFGLVCILFSFALSLQPVATPYQYYMATKNVAGWDTGLFFVASSDCSCKLEFLNPELGVIGSTEINIESEKPVSVPLNTLVPKAQGKYPVVDSVKASCTDNVAMLAIWFSSKDTVGLPSIKEE